MQELSWGKKAISVKRTDSSGWQVLLSDKTQVSAKIVVIAAGPMDTYSLFDDKERPEVLSRGSKGGKTRTPGVSGCCSQAAFQTETHCLLWG